VPLSLDFGRQEETLEAVQERMALRHDLARDKPDETNADLAYNLSNCLTSPEEVPEAIRVCRQRCEDQEC